MSHSKTLVDVSRCNRGAFSQEFAMLELCRIWAKMTYIWYVTFEVPKSSTLVPRRNPRLSKIFETEAEAKEFARLKVDAGLIVSAGTINPHRPRVGIPSEKIFAWFEASEGTGQSDENGAAT
jgi:hypothetical protein